jgi:hypothetical protein
VQWDGDNDAEIGLLVDHIIAAVTAAAAAELRGRLNAALGRIAALEAAPQARQLQLEVAIR